ncbi:MAG: hypothetical protein K9L29_10360 [Spirochaetales bacterium]|nr:hypothetical protein [Spirochaetales bacterium]MCF7949415.1 hypothetical protein [Spirochaetia bacterium]MCF7951597.1 hypothetical protein [Spirochaetaceae bacterium]
MNTTTIIKWTNRIALAAIILLVYWVFIFISITVFSLKVFQENITESFYLSVLGILALLVGAVIVNIMFNLTSISESLQEPGRSTHPTRIRRNAIILILLSFPLIFGILFLGDYRTTQVRETRLIEAAEYSIQENREIATSFLEYSFDAQYLQATAEGLQLIAHQSESFPSISVILKDSVHGKDVFLRFTSHMHRDGTDDLSKLDYIYACSPEEQEYIKSVFEDNEDRHLFSASDGSYELYYPYRSGNQAVILYFTDRQRYGKFGS